MNYNILLSQMDKMAQVANSKKRKISLKEMWKQASEIKTKSLSKEKKKSA